MSLCVYNGLMCVCVCVDNGLVFPFSIACLAALQRHGECLALVNQRLETEHQNADLYVMRARLHQLFKNVRCHKNGTWWTYEIGWTYGIGWTYEIGVWRKTCRW